MNVEYSCLGAYQIPLMRIYLKPVIQNEIFDFLAALVLVDF